MTNQLIPRLRFKQFHNQWQHKQINKLLKIKNGRSQKKVEASKGAYPILATSGKIGETNHYLYNGESVLIGRKGTINKPMYFKGHFWTVDTLFYSHLFNNSDGKFIFNLFKTINWLRYNTSSGIPSLTSRNIESINVNIPKLTEQQHIGAFFAKLDQMIKLQNKKITHLRQLKKGYLQKIFPQKGENVPRLRFNGFHDEWNTKKLKDISKWQRGKGLLKSSLNVKQQGTPVIHYADLYKFNAIQSKVIHWSTKKEGTLIPNNALLFPMSDVTPNGLATTTHMVNNYNNIKASGDTLISKIDNKYNASYISYFINAHPNKILKLVTGTSIKHINAKSLSIIKLNIPSIQEQNKIGQFFKHLDQSINRQDNKLTQLKQLKKAYLQKMFI